MSPLPLRRYRAERVLRKEFEGQRPRVLGAVRGRLRANGIAFDEDDLEGCYTQAWHGLYAALLEGQEIENPTGWLVQVCFRRAIDESRAPGRRAVLAPADRDGAEHDPAGLSGSVEPDLAGALDERLRLRHTFEGLRLSMSAREQQAASLCYLQGLSRADAAAQMGVSEARMRKLMEGSGPERPGVATKMSELVRTIGGGGWCEQQGSLMRALAFGILDPGGERYQLAQLHRRECPACRAYVVSLRGLAAVLPPLPLPWAVGAVGFGGGAAAGGGAGSGAGAGVGSGGGLFAGGSLGAKLTAGCLLVAGVGGGCVAIVAGGHDTRTVHHDRVFDVNGRGSPQGLLSAVGGPSLPPKVRSPAVRSALRPRHIAHLVPSPSAIALQAQRELGFERAPATALAPRRAVSSARLPLSSSSSTGQPATPGGRASAGHEFGIE
jgi:DNA-directed RNA polymerase specialized sigma24 family protein